MDNDEEAGLRAFALNVGTAARPRHPLWIECAGARIAVAVIDAQWREEERLGFRVRLADGAAWLLYYVPELALWSGLAVAGGVGAATPAVQRRIEHPPGAGEP